MQGKTFNGQLNIVLGCPKGASPLKSLGQLEVVLLKLQGPNFERGLALNDYGNWSWNQPRVNLAYGHVVQL